MLSPETVRSEEAVLPPGLDGIGMAWGGSGWVTGAHWAGGRTGPPGGRGVPACQPASDPCAVAASSTNVNKRAKRETMHNTAVPSAGPVAVCRVGWGQDRASTAGLARARGITDGDTARDDYYSG